MVEMKPVEGGFVIDPVELIQSSDREICLTILKLFDPKTQPLVMLSTLAQAMGWICANGAPDFESAQEAVRLTNFMVLTNAGITWTTNHPEEKFDGHRVN